MTSQVSSRKSGYSLHTCLLHLLSVSSPAPCPPTIRLSLRTSTTQGTPRPPSHSPNSPELCLRTNPKPLLNSLHKLLPVRTRQRAGPLLLNLQCHLRQHSIIASHRITRPNTSLKLFQSLPALKYRSPGCACILRTRSVSSPLQVPHAVLPRYVVHPPPHFSPSLHQAHCIKLTSTSSLRRTAGPASMETTSLISPTLCRISLRSRPKLDSTHKYNNRHTLHPKLDQRARLRRHFHLVEGDVLVLWRGSEGYVAGCEGATGWGGGV